jgi:DNA-binding response OmpR family regulator
MSGQATIKMLSIDDKTMTTDLDRAGYRKMGVYVRAAMSYDEAVKLLKAEKIDLIVINMDYKPVDACQVTKHLKSQDEHKAIPIVITSVQTAAKVRNAALDAGADLFVEQPLPRTYFIEKLKQLLEHKTRTTERIDLQGEVTFSYDGKTDKCPIGDLSVTGILLATQLDLANGLAVELEFEIPGNKKAIKATGEVVRTIRYSANHPDRVTGIGIRFVDFQGDSQKRLEKYVEKSSSDDERLLYYL